MFFPKGERLVVVPEHRYPDLIWIEPEYVGRHVPSETDRLFLEVIAEREIPQHLEECQMAGRMPYVFQVVVLSSHPDAFLGRRSSRIVPFRFSQKDVFELIHPRVDEEESRIIVRHDRRRGDDRMPLRFKII